MARIIEKERPLRPGEWEVWYSSGATFHSSQGTPNESPADYVIGMCQNTGGQHDDLVARGESNYIFRADLGYWMECNEDGTKDQWQKFAPDIICYRRGFQIPGDDFRKLQRKMQARIDQHQVTVR